MKPHSTSRPRLLVTAFAALGLASCVVPGAYDNGSYGNRSRSSYSSGIGVYTSLPVGYAGNAYHHDNRYYSGGRYETGSFHYQGRRYDNRYQQGNGSYLYGGQHQHYPGHSSHGGNSAHNFPHDSRGMGHGSSNNPSRGSDSLTMPVRRPGNGLIPIFSSRRP